MGESIPAADVLQIVWLAGGCALAAAVLGALVLRRLRSRSLTGLLLTAVCTALVGVVAGAAATGQAMFLSGHDLRVMLLVVAAAAVVGLAGAVVLARSAVAGTRALAHAATGLAGGTYESPSAALPSELAAIDRSLVDAAAELARAREREDAMERSRRELVAWVSHDLRTPLAGIRAMAEALEDGIADDPQTVDRYHQGIRRESDRLAVMVDDLFELSRINASSLQLTLQEVSLADVVSDALASARPVAEAKGVRLVGRAADDLPMVEGSVPELGRVLRNLLSNAIRHTPTDGVVHVHACARDGAAVVEVADACGGIPAEDLPRVFETAFRGTAARTPGQEGGAGLGLAIARGLVEAHHGQITIANHGPGCRVELRIPARA